MFDADNQQFMASLADIAIEIFGSESTFLRVAKHKQEAAAGETELPEALARICFERSVERVRSEASEILSALCTASEASEISSASYTLKDLRSHLEQVANWLPLPSGLIETRAFVARSVLEIGGLPASMT